MRRLYRSNTNRMIGGVCGGIAEYAGLDPTVVRVAWIVFGLAGGIGFAAYIIAWVIVPRCPAGESAPQGDAPSGRGHPDTSQGTKTLGVILVVVGGLLLLRNLGGWWFRFGIFSPFWPVALILIGAWLVTDALRGGR